MSRRIERGRPPVRMRSTRGLFAHMAGGFVVLVLVLATCLLQTPTISANSGEIVAELVDAINGARAAVGVTALVNDPALTALAGERSADMAQRGYVSHTTPEGLTVPDLLAARELHYGIAGENVVRITPVGSASVARTLQELMNSAPHRANLLEPRFSQIGVGMASGDGRAYVTVLFRGYQEGPVARSAHSD